MKKQELKSIIKEMRDLHNELSYDDSLCLVTSDNKFYFISAYDELPPKVSINRIEVAIYQGWDNGLYLRNGLKSFRQGRKANLI